MGYAKETPRVQIAGKIKETTGATTLINHATPRYHCSYHIVQPVGSNFSISTFTTIG